MLLLAEFKDQVLRYSNLFFLLEGHENSMKLCFMGKIWWLISDSNFVEHETILLTLGSFIGVDFKLPAQCGILWRSKRPVMYLRGAAKKTGSRYTDSGVVNSVWNCWSNRVRYGKAFEHGLYLLDSNVHLIFPRDTF